MRSGARLQRPLRDPRRPHRAMPEWRSNPRERRESPIKNRVLVPGARSLTTTAAGTDQPKYGMIVGEGGNPSSPVATCTGQDRGGWNEPSSTSTHTGKIAALDQAPDGCTRYSERLPGFLDGDHLCSHTTIVSQQSHRLRRITPHAQGPASCPPELDRPREVTSRLVNSRRDGAPY